ncbi:RagB/SusD family nutrient uptake outer membrane protein [Leeuwenhoekiella aequorea]|uniref:RagB/SusD family nutrient uptake outer membrane protein n=1 Tax=Leeuwenhoekiella aequorea TaxID=283736 RepID=UPI00352C6494|tara:strand:+ start:191 stop:1588 length:1398 start_codon:yes stop_codon:yes gene_type:complete
MKRFLIYTHPKLLLGLGVLLNLIFTGCESFIEVDLPPGQLTGEAVFTDLRTAEAALTDIYALQRDQGILSGGRSGIASNLALYTDVYEQIGSQSSDPYFFYTHTLNPDTQTLSNFWNTSFNSIYAANALIKGIPASLTLDVTQAQRPLGEAYFIRGLMHFYLTNLFGAIPYVTTNDYLVNQKVSKLSVEEIYIKVTEDLLEAERLIPEVYSSTERTRPNAFAVKSLLARVYLYEGEWQKAYDKAGEILESELYSLNIPIDQLFLKDSKNTIWQFMPQNAGANTLEGRNFILRVLGSQYAAFNPDFVCSFEPGDLRKESWIDSVTENGTTAYFPIKYREELATASSLEYSKVLRIGEVYLIRAEAAWRLNRITQALADLNALRQRAGLPPIDSATPAELENLILAERRAELFTEFGHRWFDLNRWNKAETLLKPIKPGWGMQSYLLPIPETELGANPNLLPQNHGY